MKIVLIMFLFFSVDASARSKRSNLAGYQETWSLAIGGGYTSRVLVHEETSSNSNYLALNDRIRVPEISFSLSLLKEFLNQNRFSFTLMLMGALTDSSGSSESNAEEELSSYQFGGGASLNYNSFLYGLKVQPYLGLLVTQEQGEFILTSKNSGTSISTVHEFEAQVAQATLGVRIFDKEVRIMSYFQLGFPSALSETYQASAQVGTSPAEITRSADITRDVFTFSLGFGYYF